MNIDLSEEKIKKLYKILYSYPIEPFKSVFIWFSHSRRLNEIL